MPVKTRGPLTEAMFYILMVLSRGNVCGTEIASSVAVITRGRVRLGPGTLYTLLAKFLDEGFVTEVGVEGRMRTYSITESGRAVYERELERLRTCLADASDAAEGALDAILQTGVKEACHDTEDSPVSALRPEFA